MAQNTDRISEYIEDVLSKIAILDEAEVGYENIEILEFRTHHDSGKMFTNQRDENYGIAILNAITDESANKISREIKKNSNLSVTVLDDFVEKHLLKCFVAGDSESYKTWKTGDIGVASLVFDDVKKVITPNFSNESVIKRNK